MNTDKAKNLIAEVVNDMEHFEAVAVVTWKNKLKLALVALSDNNKLGKNTNW